MRVRLLGFLLSFLAVLLLQPVFAQSPGERAEVLSRLNQVQSFLEQGNLLQATRFLASVEAESPAELLPYVRAVEGNLALRQGDYQGAIATYQGLLTAGFEPPGNRLVMLNNYVRALLKREQIYLAQAEEDLERRTEFASLALCDRQQARTLLAEALQIAQTGNASAEIRAELNLAELEPGQANLEQMEQDISLLPASTTQVELLLDLAEVSSEGKLFLLQRALEIAQKLGISRSQSWTWGALGRYYEEKKSYREALAASHQAQWAAQEALDWARVAQWQWQAARIERKLEEPQKATLFYRQAVESLHRLRQELAGSRIGQSLYLDTIEPLLRDYLGFLLGQLPVSSDSLREAIGLLKLNQLAELDNYFGDICQIAVQNDIFQEPKTTEIYTVILPQQTYEILELPDRTYSLFIIPISEVAFKQQILNWRHNLQNSFSKEYQRESRWLYDALVRPLEPVLTAQKIAHLIFVQDGVLRNVPMSALYDSQRQEFLIERLAVSYSLGLRSTATLTTPRNPLIAGTSEATLKFPNPIPAVIRETQQLQALLGGTILLNEAFTEKSLAARLEEGDYQLLHLASHGRFTGLSEEAFFQTGGEILSLQEFEQLLRAQPSPLAHLTLSACETAVGNRYAVLGVAGVGVRAGIESVLGSLWFVSDQKTSDFVLDFYRNWSQGDPIEEALRKSQIRQIRQGLYPVYWAHFVLLKG